MKQLLSLSLCIAALSFCSVQAAQDVMPSDNESLNTVIKDNDTTVNTDQPPQLELDNEAVGAFVSAEPDNAAVEKDGGEVIEELDNGYVDNDTLYDSELENLEYEGFEGSVDTSAPPASQRDTQPEQINVDQLLKEKKQLELDIAIAPADIILLANGESVEGVIRHETDEIVSIETSEGLAVYHIEEIDYIDEMPEKDRFQLLQKLEELHEINRKLIRLKLEKEKEKVEAARQREKYFDIASGMEEGDLFTLTRDRLEKIIKDFAQFPPDYWRYYQRRADAMKALLHLKRLKRYAHPAYTDTLELYIKAFDAKIQELGESDDSALRAEYEDTYKQYFRLAERRRLTVMNPE